jgi:glucose-6-phosphate 1-dehydrogenase
MRPPLTIIIFGASGDLTRRKLIPSLYRLHAKGRLEEEARIVGVSRSPLSDEGFHSRLAQGAREFTAGAWDAQEWDRFAQRIHYVQADATTSEGMQTLEAHLRGHEGEQARSRRLYYLSVSPDLYEGILQGLGLGGMHRVDPPGWRRVVIEKPFGRDRASARALNQKLSAVFSEEETYRIDHYLGKETVQNILVFRFANTLFEPLWNHNYIEHVQITVSEEVTVGNRAPYYDRAGVLRDMFQNHLLQVLALVAIEAPARFSATPLRNEKVKVLDAVAVYSEEEARKHVVTGQYEGYLAEKGVAANSRTPTYAAVELYIDNWRWRGVPFYLRSGKAMPGRLSEVVIQFRCPPHLMFPLPEGTTLECNRLAMCLQPDEGIHINFQSKVPDEEGVVLRPAGLEFHYRDTYRNTPIPEAYERLLQDALAGDASLFMRSDEIERAWEIMDPIIAAVESHSGPPPETYPLHSEGPCCADDFLARSGRSWLSLCRHEGNRGEGDQVTR